MQRQTRATTILGVITILLVACTPASLPPQPAPGAKAEVPPPSEGEPTSRALLTKVCTMCGGPFARIAAFRDASGSLKRLRYDGDLRRCSHPPRIWFDERGRETLTIANRPLEVGSKEADAIMAKQAEQEAGLVEAEGYSCPE